VGRIGADLLARIDAAKSSVDAAPESTPSPGRGVGVKGKSGRPARGRVAEKAGEPEQPNPERVSPSAVSPPSRRGGVTLDAIADRAAVVFGTVVGEQLRQQGETLAYRVGGRLDCVMAAVAHCEVTNFRPDTPVGFLIWMANKMRSSGIPERVQARLALPPRPIGSEPRPSAKPRASQIRPPTYFRAIDHPIHRDPAKGNVSMLETVHRYIREKREAELAAR
jgi:hypothetical protein